jgi:hypothetical protein
MRRESVLVLAALLCGSAAIAAPSGEIEAIKQHGASAYERRDFATALDDYWLHYLLTWSAASAWNVGRLNELLRRELDAAGAYERYCELAVSGQLSPTSPDPGRVRARAAELRSRTGWVDAGERNEEARHAFGAGQYAYEHHDHPLALVQFYRSYLLSSSPDLIYNIALVYEARGDYVKAALAFERYLQQTLDDPRTRPFRERVRSRAEVDRTKARLEPSPIATVSVAAPVPPPAALPLGLAPQTVAGYAQPIAYPALDAGRNLQDGIVEARKYRNRGTAMVVWGTLFGVTGLGMMMTGIAASAGRGSNGFPATIGLTGLFLPTGIAIPLLAVGSRRVSEGKRRIAEAMAALERAQRSVVGFQQGGEK